MMPLDLLSTGEQAEVVDISHCGGCGGGCHDDGRSPDRPRHNKQNRITRAEEMGLRIGKKIEMLKNDGNLLLLLVDETRIAIDRRMARGIRVKGV